jgi:hypothetical protein
MEAEVGDGRSEGDEARGSGCEADEGTSTGRVGEGGRAETSGAASASASTACCC